MRNIGSFRKPALFEMKNGAYMIDFGKDASAKAVTETKPVTTENPVTNTSAKSPFPVLGILAGLGISGILVMRRR